MWRDTQEFFGPTGCWWAPSHRRMDGVRRTAPRQLAVETLQTVFLRVCKRVAVTKPSEWLATAQLQVTWKTAPQAQYKLYGLSIWL